MTCSTMNWPAERLEARTTGFKVQLKQRKYNSVRRQLKMLCVLKVTSWMNLRRLCDCLRNLPIPEAEFMNIQFRSGLWAKSWEFSYLRIPLLYLQYKLVSNHFCSRGGGVKSVSTVKVTVNSKEEKSQVLLSQLRPRIRPQVVFLGGGGGGGVRLLFFPLLNN